VNDNESCLLLLQSLFTVKEGTSDWSLIVTELRRRKAMRPRGVYKRVNSLVQFRRKSSESKKERIRSREIEVKQGRSESKKERVKEGSINLSYRQESQRVKSGRGEWWAWPFSQPLSLPYSRQSLWREVVVGRRMNLQSSFTVPSGKGEGATKPLGPIGGGVKSGRGDGERPDSHFFLTALPKEWKTEFNQE